MTRNREATSARIVEAVGRVLARAGFRGLSLRAVAREAGVDKRLLSRYFGGLDPLIAAYAAGSDFWWTVDELVGDHLPGPTGNTWAGWLCLAVQRHTQALRQRALTQEILAWEMIEPNALTEELSAVRERRAAELIERIQKKLGTQADASWRAVGALMAAATTYLIVRAHTCDFYLGIDLHAEDAWKQFDEAIEAIARGAIAEPAPPRSAATRGVASTTSAPRPVAATTPATISAPPRAAVRPKTAASKAAASKTAASKAAASKAATTTPAPTRPKRR